MKKAVTSFIAVLFICHIGYGQAITLRDTGLVLISQDTMANLLDPNIVSSFGQPLTNGTWDLSPTQYQYPVRAYRERQTPFGNYFPTASYSERGGVVIDAGGFYFFNVSNYYSVDSSGVNFLGQHGNTTRIPIAIITGNNNDSLTFPAQTILRSPDLKALSFPTTMGGTWGGPTSCTSQLLVTSAVGNLVDAPMTVKNYYYTVDTVVGWGKMRVRLTDTTKISDYVPVLQVHTLYTEVDSFFMNGMSAPDSVLNYLGLVQGHSQTSYQTEFLREGEIEPLLRVFFLFPNHVRPFYAQTTLMRLPVSQAAGIKGIKAGALSVYPNPARTREVNISWPGSSGTTFKYALTNFGGSRIASGVVQLNHSLELQDNLPAGIYCLTIIDNDGYRESVPLVLE